MRIISNLLYSDMAIVKHDGIYYEENRYTSSYAIKNRWFEKASVNGPWQITIYFDPQVHGVILVLADSGHMFVAGHISQLSLGELPKNIKEYYESINYLKTLRNRRKKLNRNRSKIKNSLEE